MIRRLQHALVASWIFFTLLALANAVAVSAGWYATAVCGLLRFAGAVVLFLVLHLIRIPLVLTARVLEGVMCRVDDYATRQATPRPQRPINQFFAPSTASAGEAS
jgi:hypothetical protein